LRRGLQATRGKSDGEGEKTLMSVVTSSTKVDLYKQRPNFFRASRTPELVDLPEANYLVVDGQGEAGGSVFQDRIGALFSVAYTLKFAAKLEGRDFKVPTIECSWWILADGDELPPEQWRWQLLLMVPDFVDEAAVEGARTEVSRKKRKLDPTEVRLERIEQGKCVQILHIGPYAEEDTTIEEMLSYVRSNGLEADGPHHEVYLSDPKRTKPESLKTIIRQHVKHSAS
jgi:hypothetical protein